MVHDILQIRKRKFWRNGMVSWNFKTFFRIKRFLKPCQKFIRKVKLFFKFKFVQTLSWRRNKYSHVYIFKFASLNFVFRIYLYQRYFFKKYYFLKTRINTFVNRCNSMSDSSPPILSVPVIIFNKHDSSGDRITFGLRRAGSSILSG